MHHLLNHFAQVSLPKAPINLHVLNTFFALSVATYYVAAHHMPKTVRWSFHMGLDSLSQSIADESIPSLGKGVSLTQRNDHMNFASLGILDQVRDDSSRHYALHHKQQLRLNDGYYKNPPLSVVIPDLIQDPYRGVAHTLNWTQPIHAEIEQWPFNPLTHLPTGLPYQDNGNLTGFPHTPQFPHLPPAQTHEALQILEENQNIEQQSVFLPLSAHLVSHVSNRPSFNEGEVSIPASEMGQSLADPGIRAEMIRPVSNTNPQEEAILPLPRYRMSSFESAPSAPLSTHIVLQESNHLTEAPQNPQTPQLPPAQTQETLQILEESQNVEQQTELLPLNSPHASRATSSTEREASIPLMAMVQNLVNAGTVAETVNPAPVVSPQEPLLHWSQYMLRVKNHKNPVLTFWLMKLAPGSMIPLDEIPFRRALIETALSPQFQPDITFAWEEDDDEAIKALRRNFHNAYTTTVLGQENLHLVKLDDYLYAYEFPLKLGIRAYRDEDLPVAH